MLSNGIITYVMVRSDLRIALLSLIIILPILLCVFFCYHNFHRITTKYPEFFYFQIVDRLIRIWNGGGFGSPWNYEEKYRDKIQKNQSNSPPHFTKNWIGNRKAKIHIDFLDNEMSDVDDIPSERVTSILKLNQQYHQTTMNKIEKTNSIPRHDLMKKKEEIRNRIKKYEKGEENKENEEEEEEEGEKGDRDKTHPKRYYLGKGESIQIDF